jgi:hypothetical protein
MANKGSGGSGGGFAFVLPPALKWQGKGDRLADGTRRLNERKHAACAPAANLFGWFDKGEGKPRSNQPSKERLKKALTQVRTRPLRRDDPYL